MTAMPTTESAKQIVPPGSAWEGQWFSRIVGSNSAQRKPRNRQSGSIVPVLPGVRESQGFSAKWEE